MASLWEFFDVSILFLQNLNYSPNFKLLSYLVILKFGKSKPKKSTENVLKVCACGATITPVVIVRKLKSKGTYYNKCVPYAESHPNEF